MIIDDIRINQNYGKKKSSFRVIDDGSKKWLSYEEKIIGPDGYEHLPGNIIFIAEQWLCLAAKNKWEYYDKDGNTQDLKKVCDSFIKQLKYYFEDENSEYEIAP